MAVLRAIPRSSFALILSALIIAAAISFNTLYSARGVPADTTYHACLYAGSLSQVNTVGPPANCGRGSQVSWNSQGIQGLPGVDGINGVDGVSGWEQVTERAEFTDFTSTNPSDYQVRVECPGSKRAMGGGGIVQWYSPTNFLQLGSLAYTYPVGGLGDEWLVGAQQPPIQVTLMVVTAYVICASVN